MHTSSCKNSFLLAFSLTACALSTARAEITYIDAAGGASGNTFATGGSLSDTSWANTSTDSANNTQWSKRTGIGNNGTIIQGWYDGGSSLPELTTQITGLADGHYDVWVFFWTGGNPAVHQWNIAAGLTSGNLTTYSVTGEGNTTAAVAASTLTFTDTILTSENDGARNLWGVNLGRVTVAENSIDVFVDSPVDGGQWGYDRTWYDGVGYASASSPPPPPPPPPPEALGPPLLGIDFNRTDIFGSPSQSFFRIVGGSTTQEDNAASYTKPFGPRQVTVTQPDGEKLEFRGGNGDNSRAIPGGDTSLSFLVADFVASRRGAIDLEIAGLPAGDYIFRSWHLDTLTTGTLGFAQGATTTTPNTIQARIDGDLMGSVPGTSLGSAGLGTTFINDAQIPRIEFEFSHDGSSPLIFELRSTESNGTDNFLLLNGFAIYPKNP